MSKVTIDIITSGYNLSKINANFVLLQDELNNNVLYRTNPAGEPNSMSNDIDMNSKDILNTNVVAAQSVTISGVSVVPGDTLIVPSAINVPYTPTGDIIATDVQAMGAELDNGKIAKIIPATVGNVATLTTDGSVSDSGITSAELGYLNGTTSNIQAQLDGKAGTSFKGVLVYNSIAHSLNTGATPTLTWNSEAYDTDSLHSTSSNTERLVVPAGVTKVRLSSHIVFSANDNGSRQVYISRNPTSTYGIAYSNVNASQGQLTPITVHTGVMEVSEGDYFYIRVYQNSGSTLTTSIGVDGSWFAMEIVE